MRVLISTLVILAIHPVQASAQAAFAGGATPGSSINSAPSPRVHAGTGPTIESAAIGVRSVESSDATAQRRSTRRSGVSRDIVLMVVGGATMVAGSFIDGEAGTIFMVGGALIALWGLYNFLQ